jgi:hypothetical protein
MDRWAGCLGLLRGWVQPLQSMFGMRWSGCLALGQGFLLPAPVVILLHAPGVWQFL